MPEDTESLETLSVGIEADVSKLLQGARDGVDEASQILETIPPVEPQINTLPMLGKITEIINRYTDLQLTVEQVVGAINAGLAENATEVEKLAGMMLEYSAIQQQSMAATGREFVQMGMLNPVDVQIAISHLAGLGEMYHATQEEVIAFASQMDVARTALHEMGMSAVQTGELIGRTHDSIGMVIAGFEQLGSIPMEQALGIINQGMEAGATAGEKLAGTLMELMYAQSELPATLVGEMWTEGTISATEAGEALRAVVVGLGTDYQHTVEEVAEFQQSIVSAHAGVGEIWQSWADQVGEVRVRIGEVAAGFSALGEITVGQTMGMIQEGLAEAATEGQKLLGTMVEFGHIHEWDLAKTALVMWAEGFMTTEEAATALGAAVEGVGKGFQYTSEEVTAFRVMVAEAEGAIYDMWSRFEDQEPVESSQELRHVISGIGESVQLSGQLLQQMNENTTAGLSTNVELMRTFLDLMNLRIIPSGYTERAETLDRINASLQNLVLSQDQATTAMLRGSAEGATAMEQLTGNVVRLSTDVQIPFNEIVKGLLQMGVVSREVAGQIVTSLQQIASTTVNESPLSASLRSILSLLDAVVVRAQAAATAVTGIGRQVPGGRLEQVGIIPDPSLMERAGQRIRTIFQGIQAAGVSAVGQLRQSFVGLRAAEDDAAAGASNLSAIIQRGMQEGAAMTDQLAAFVARLAQENNLAVQEVIAGLVDSRQISKDVGKDLLGIFGEAEKGASGLGKVLSGLGTIAKSVFGVAFGLTAVKALRKVIALMTEAAETAIKFQTNLVRLDIAVRAAQRAQGESVGTIRDWRGHVQELNEEFRNLSEVQLAEGAAQTVLLTRELQLNEEQMMRVYRTAASLASLHGIQMRQALTLTVQGLTGIGRGLRRYGVFLSRAQLNTEAFAMGLEKTWTELNSNERALVALNVIGRQVEPIIEDLSHLYGTLGGRVQVATASLQDAKSELGRIGAPLLVLWKEGLAALMTFVGESVKAITTLIATVTAGTVAFHTFIYALQRGVPVAEAITAATAAFDDTLLTMSEQFGLLGPLLEDVSGEFVDFGDALDEETEEILETLEKYGDRFEDALMAYHRALADAAEDLEEKLADLHRKYQRQLEEALQDLMYALDDLERQYVRKRADIIQDANDKLARLDEEGNEKRAKMIEDHLIKMRRMWEDHQTKLRRMREDFEDSMREAVSKRDAWGAVQAIRSFAKSRRRAVEDYDIKRRRAEEDFARRLAEGDKEREEERRRILEAMRRQLEDLEIWRARRREEIHEDYQEDLEDLAIAHAEQEEETRRSYAQRLEDIEISLERKLAAIAEAMADEEAITAAGAAAVFAELFKVFGFGGDIDQLMDAFEKRLARNIRIRVAIERAIGDGGAVPGLQHGGTVIARKPTLVEFGEAGPEMATFIPLRQWSRMQTAAQHAGTLRVEVSADEHFSADFEDMVARQLSTFVRRVVA